MVIIKPDALRFGLTWWAQRAFMFPLVWFTYRVLNDTQVIGAEHFDAVEGRTVILAPNHTSAWDSWVGTAWALTGRRRLMDRASYTCALAAPERVPTPALKLLTGILGAIPVDRDRGIEQEGLQDVLRIMRDPARHAVVTIYPEGTRSQDGRVRKKGKAGIGWLQHMTGAPIVPLYHADAWRMPGVGMNLHLRVGKPLFLERWRGAPAEPATYRGITQEVMAALRGLEAESDKALGRKLIVRRERARPRLAARTPATIGASPEE
jgi:1-acyl-sn-glycerol-3-phosphate acyltransferase